MVGWNPKNLENQLSVYSQLKISYSEVENKSLLQSSTKLMLLCSSKKLNG